MDSTCPTPPKEESPRWSGAGLHRRLYTPWVQGSPGRRLSALRVRSGSPHLLGPRASRRTGSQRRPWRTPSPMAPGETRPTGASPPCFGDGIIQDFGKVETAGSAGLFPAGWAPAEGSRENPGMLGPIASLALVAAGAILVDEGGESLARLAEEVRTRG